MTLDETKRNSEQRIKNSIEALKTELAKLRTGRAHPSLLDHVLVNSYGNDVPINQVASITIADPRTLLVTPWEKNMVEAVDKAIRNADLGLNPAASGPAVRVPLPALNEERRKEMIKLVRSEAENARVAVRNIRRDANNQFKDLLKDKKITEDNYRRDEDTLQKMTDKLIKEIESIIVSKEKELMEV